MRGALPERAEERSPPRGPRFFNRKHIGLPGQLIRLARVAADTGADEVFPRGFSTLVPRDHVIEVEFLHLEPLPAVLAGIPVTREDVLARKFHLFLWETVVDGKDDDLRNLERVVDRVDNFPPGSSDGMLKPRTEVVSVEVVLPVFLDNLRVPQEEERKSPFCRTRIDRLPKPVQNKNGTVQ